MNRYQGWTQAGSTLTTIGVESTDTALKVHPGSTVTVYQAGTVTPLSIYSDDGITPKANPFTAGADGGYAFYTASATCDVRVSGTGVSVPFTLPSVSPLGGVPVATTAVSGSVKIDTAATDAAAPIAVSATNPFLISALTTAALAALTAATGALRYVTDGAKGFYRKTSAGLWRLLLGHFDVSDYGATGDGTTDDTAAIQAAITACGSAGGGTVFFPQGTYKVSGLTVASNNVRLKGCGRSSRIAMSQGTGDTITFDNGLSGAADNTYHYGIGAEDLYFEPLVTRTSGWELKSVHFNVAYFQRLFFYNVYGCMLLGRSTDYSVISHVSDIRAKQYYYGIKAISVLDGWFNGLSFDTYNITAGATGLWLSGSTEGCGLSNIDIVNAHPSAPASSNTTYALRIYNDAGTSTGVRFNKFSNCQFDSHNPGARIDDGHDNRFTSCWFASWRDSALVVTGTVSHTTFVNCDAVNSYVDGFFVDATGGGIIFDACTALANGRSGAGYGFDISGTASHIQIVNCKAVNDSINFPGNTQQYGLNVAVGVTYLTVTNSDFSANTVGAYNILSASNTIRLDNNTTDYGVGDAVRAYRNASQSIPNNAQTAVQFNAERNDPNTMHDPVTNNTRLVARTNGFYLPSACIQFATSGTGYRQVSFCLFNSDGTGATYVGAHQNTAPLAGASTIIGYTGPALWMTAGQYIEVHVLQNSGGALDIEVGSAFTPEASLVKP